MQIEELREDLVLCLFAVKQAFDRGVFADADYDALNALFRHGVLYKHILDHASLCDEGTLRNIDEYCGLIEDAFPPPVVEGEPLRLELVKGASHGSKLRLSEAIHTAADKLFRAVIVDLLLIFQWAILDLSAKLKSTENLTPVDIENTNYVVGMAEITATNLGIISDQKPTLDSANASRIQKFFADVTRFADSLRSSGLGMMVVAI